jgi:tetratricopeptide (TPR) repeat protein
MTDAIHRSAEMDKRVPVYLGEQMSKVLSTLTPREEMILRMRFGIGRRAGQLADINTILGAGKPEEVLAYAQKAIRLDPRHPQNYSLQEGQAYNRMGRYAEAVDALKRSEQNNPWVHVNLLYAYSELGREQDARAEATEVLRISPKFSLEELERMHGNWHGPLGQRYLSDMRKAGLK